MENITVVFVGIGGYGIRYINDLLDNPDSRVRAVGLVEPYPERCERINELKNVPLYADMDSFYKEHSADLAVISTPIAFHTDNIITALKNGSNVLCEKPLCGDKADIPVLLEAEKKYNRSVMIGYQWSWSKAVTLLKEDVLNGSLGAPKELKTLVLWPRDKTYYSRGTGWAGKISVGNGKKIYDSVANNAAAHYLHNMLFVTGKKGESALPVTLDAELLRANDIENFDAAKIDMTLVGGAHLCFLGAHCIENRSEPIFLYEFENGTVCYAKDKTELLPAWYTDYGMIAAKLGDKIKVYGDPFEQPMRKYHMALNAVNNGCENICGIKAASSHTRVINRLQETVQIKNAKRSRIREKDGLIYVEGLEQALKASFKDTFRGIGDEFFE